MLARDEETGSRRVLVSHLVNEIPPMASLYFGRMCGLHAVLETGPGG